MNFLLSMHRYFEGLEDQIHTLYEVEEGSETGSFAAFFNISVALLFGLDSAPKWWASAKLKIETAEQSTLLGYVAKDDVACSATCTSGKRIGRP